MKTLVVLAALLMTTTSQAFDKGDIVYLKSGGPDMSVTEIIEKGDVGVKWFAGQQLQAGTFPPEALTTEDPTPNMQVKREKEIQSLRETK